MRIVEPSDPAFDQLWADLLGNHVNPTAMISESHFEFRKLYLGDRLAGRFRVVVENAGKAVCGSCLDLIDGVLDAVAVPSAAIVTKDVPNAALEALRDWIAARANPLRFVDQMVMGLSDLSLWALGKGAKVEPQFMQVIDLTQDEAALWTDMGKSCKTRTNWGLKNLQVEVSRDRAAFDALRRLHLLAAGGSTRSDATWDIQWRMVENDEAFLTTSAMNGEIVSASLFQLSRNDCYYGVSAGDRALFKKPIGHAPLWKAICHAKERGRLRFWTGHQVWEPSASHKEATIAEFKRSFGGKTVAECIVDLPFVTAMPGTPAAAQSDAVQNVRALA